MSKASLKVIDMFTKKTLEEEAQDQALEEVASSRERGTVDHDADAVRWLKTDAGLNDEIRLACHKDGRVVMQFMRITNSGTHVSTSSFLLTKDQADGLMGLLLGRSDE